jgi:cysteine desulfurase
MTGPEDEVRPAYLDAPIYLDYNATTPVDPRVVAAMSPYLIEVFANPSSAHHLAGPPKAALQRAREQVTDLVGANSEEIVFTGSGSEADALAILGVVRAALLAGRRRPHVVTQVTEHPAVLGACEALQRLHPVDVTYLPVDQRGLIDPAALADALTPRTVLVSIMHANNETGVLQPIHDLADLTHRVGALLHTDAAQTAAKIPVDVAELGVDLLTVVGHKMYAPKGIGALYVREGIQLDPLIPGGGQERGRRAGTENVALAVALGAAADLAGIDLKSGQPQRLARLRDRLHDGLQAQLPGRVHLNGHPDHRLPHTLNISIDGIDSTQLLETTPSIAASTGSACHSGNTTPSPVLTGMGLPPDRTRSALRLSLGRWSTTGDIDQAITTLTNAIHNRDAHRRPSHAISRAERPG